jgi:hypothetical protein
LGRALDFALDFALNNRSLAAAGRCGAGRAMTTGWPQRQRIVRPMWASLV